MLFKNLDCPSIFFFSFFYSIKSGTILLYLFLTLNYCLLALDCFGSVWSSKCVLHAVLLRYVAAAVLPFGLPNGNATVYISCKLLLVDVVIVPCG
jgi:hypothetical protein